MADPSPTSIVALILGSGVVSAALTQGVGVFLAWRGTRRAAEYLALRLALVVERLGEDCLDTAQEHDNFISSRGSAGAMAQSLPRMDQLPGDDAAWRALPADLSARVLGIEPRIRATDRMIGATWEYADPEMAMDECRKEAVLLGCDAALLGRDLRRRMGLPAMQAKWDWPRRLDDLRVEIYRARDRTGVPIPHDEE